MEIDVLVVGMNILTSKWLFIVEETPNVSGNMNIPKLRLTFQKFLKIHGVDFIEIYASVVQIKAHI